MILTGDCRAILPTLDAGSVDVIVTDPLLGIELSSEYVRIAEKKTAQMGLA